MILPALLLLVPLAVQDASAPPPADPPVATPDVSLPLRDEEVARVDGVSIAESEYLRYLGTVYARRPEGDEALRRLVVRAVSSARARQLGLEIGDVAVARLERELLERAAAASPDGKAPDALRAQFERPEVRRSLADLALERELVRHDDGLPADAPVDDARVAAFVEATYEGALVAERPLDDALAATWDGGRLTREDFGRAVSELIDDEERSGVLTELVGILLVQRKAAALGVAFSPEEAAAELAERQAYVARAPGAEGLTYDDVLEKLERRTRAELVASPAFIAQILLRTMVARHWDEERVRDLWTAERTAAAPGATVDWDAERHAAWRAVRQRTYRQLFAECTILRRF